jgi:hypothetical protein
MTESAFGWVFQAMQFYTHDSAAHASTLATGRCKTVAGFSEKKSNDGIQKAR